MKNIINISSLRVVLATTALSLMMIGCGSEDPKNEGNHIPDVNIVQNNKTVNVGTKVNLTAIAVDVDNDTLKNKWSFTSKPTGSSATLTTNTKNSTSFTADKAGKYVVKFSSKDIVDAEGKDTVTITAKELGAISNTCTSYTELARTSYTKNATLDGCYKVTGDISVSNNALLTIKAGSTLIFEGGTELDVSSDGALSAKGTATAPILFSATQKTAGFWDGIYFTNSNNIKNELDHIIIEYAGKNGYGALTLYSYQSAYTRLKVSNSVFRYSSSHGFYFYDYSLLDKFENITSTKNKLTAGFINPSSMSALDSKSKFTGNIGKDLITLGSGYLTKSATWNKLTVPIYINGTITVNNEATLTIKAGAVFKAGDGAEISIASNGALIAKGTAKEPIVFTAMQQTAGYWDGIYFTNSNNVKNELDHIKIEYAGKNGYGAITTYSYQSSPTRLKISNSTIKHSGAHGFYFYDYTILGKFENVTSTDNTLTAGFLNPSALGAIDSKSQFKGRNGKDVLTLDGGYLKKSATWNKLTVPLYIDGTVTITNGAILTIQAGTVFKAGTGSQIAVNSDGALTAKGTSKEPIIFSAMQQTAGYWEGIYFTNSNNNNNQLDHIKVEYAGQNGYGAITTYSYQSAPTTISITNSTFSDSSNYGIYAYRYTNINSDFDTSNTFINNAKGTATLNQ